MRHLIFRDPPLFSLLCKSTIVGWQLLVLGMFLLSPIASSAQPIESLKNRSSIEAKVTALLKSYANALGCDFKFDKSNIVRTDIDGDGEKEYVAIFYIDTTCSHTNTQGREVFAVIDFDSRDRIVVRANVSQPAVRAIGFPRFIDRIFLKGDQLWYTGKEFDWDKDALCCPSVSVEGRVMLRKSLVQVDGQNDFNIWYWIDSRKR